MKPRLSLRMARPAMAAAVWLLGGGWAGAADETPPPAPRFSAGYMDRTVDPRVDFARFAAGNWYRTTVIPRDRSSWGGFQQLDERNRVLIRQLLEDAAAHPGAPGSLQQKVGDFYGTAMDTAAVEAAGAAPIAEDWDRIAGAATVEDLLRVVAGLHTVLLPPPFRPGEAFVPPSAPMFNFDVPTDARRSSVYVLELSQGGLGLPTRDYYLDARLAAARSAYVEHIGRMLTLAGESAEAAGRHAATVFALEKSLAEASRTPVQLRDPIANYHKMSIAALAAASPGLPVKVYFEALGYPAAAGDIVVGQPEFFAALGRLLREQPLDDWKAYLRWRVLSAAAPYLSTPLAEESFHFNGAVLNGVPEMEPRWLRMERLLDGQIGEAVGRLYTDRYFPPETRARLAVMVGNIEAAMRSHLEHAGWMSEPTRARALAKFARFRALIGVPPKWRDYGALTIRRDRLFANIRRAGQFEVRRLLGRAGRPVDRDEFGLPPQIVNAYFQATANQIVFLAGILQPPFFDPDLDDAVNYGALGAVIGHEITHGYDDRGRLYDADGNLADWWTPADAAEFKARAQRVVDEYNHFHALPGLPVNGELTLGENIADLGGVVVAYDALERSLAGRPRPPLIDGLTPEQRFFVAYAQLWRSQYRDDALRRQVMSNEHSPGQIRAVGPLVNLPQFYEAFGIQPGDPMWRAPDQRAEIW